MRFSTILFDLDDTLYPRSSGLWPAIANRIDLYIHTRLNIPWENVPPLRQSLFSQYGTTLRGLLALYQIDPEEYLLFVHDVPVKDYLSPDPQIRRVLQDIPLRKVIFTNADFRHAQRVLNILNIEDCFEQIIDILSITPYCKPQPEAYQIALEKIAEPNGSRCVLIDDSFANLNTAKSFGFFTIHIGEQSHQDQNSHDVSILQLSDIAEVLPV